jgi:hypothetical protein
MPRRDPESGALLFDPDSRELSEKIARMSIDIKNLKVAMLAVFSVVDMSKLPMGHINDLEKELEL